MTHPNPGKDTQRVAREQAREVILNWANKQGLDAGNVMADEVAPDFIAHIAAALSRARREGMEEAAGIADKLSTGNIVPSRGRANGGIMAKAIAQEIRRAAKEDDRG